jgi:hypothetical protein
MGGAETERTGGARDHLTPARGPASQLSITDNNKNGVKNAVLVHGAFVDGSGWQRVRFGRPVACLAGCRRR